MAYDSRRSKHLQFLFGNGSAYLRGVATKANEK